VKLKTKRADTITHVMSLRFAGKVEVVTGAAAGED
jgi:hypothetical protein